MCDLYQQFSSEEFDFSEEMMVELFCNETYGDPVSSTNGFYVGKKWLNVTVAMWKEDIESGDLLKIELMEDGRLPRWWLDRVIKNFRPPLKR